MLWVGVGSGTGGMEMAMWRIARRLDADREMTLIPPMQSKPDWVRAARGVARRITYGTDVVHTFGGSATGIYGLGRRMARQRPCHVAWVRNALNEWYGSPVKRQVILTGLREADMCVSVSRTVQSQLAALGIDSYILHNWVEGTSAPRGGWSASFSGPIVWVGRLARAKLPELVLEGWLLAGKPRNLVFAGDGPLKPMLERRVRDCGAQVEARFVGHIERTNELMRDGSMLTAASLYEGHSNSVLNAYGEALPVLATPGIGAEEGLGWGQYGRVCRGQSAEAVAESMGDILSCRGTWAEASRASSKGGHAFTWEAVEEEYNAFVTALNEVVGQKV